MIGRAPRSRALQEKQIPGLRAHHGGRRYPMIERHEAAIVGNSKREQIDIRDLVVTQDARPVDHSSRAQRNIVGPERMVRLRADVGEFVRDDLESDRPELTVTREIQDADDAVLDERARGDPELAPFDEFQRLRMEYVRLVEQCNPDVDVQQMPHALQPFLVHQRAHVFGGNDLAARGQDGVSGLGLRQNRLRLALRPDAVAGQTRNRFTQRNVFALGMCASVSRNVVVESKCCPHAVSLASTHHFRIIASICAARRRRHALPSNPEIGDYIGKPIHVEVLVRALRDTPRGAVDA